MNPNNPTGQRFSQTGVSLSPDQLPLPGSEWRTPPLFFAKKISSSRKLKYPPPPQLQRLPLLSPLGYHLKLFGLPKNGPPHQSHLAVPKPLNLGVANRRKKKKWGGKRKTGKERKIKEKNRPISRGSTHFFLNAEIFYEFNIPSIWTFEIQTFTPYSTHYIHPTLFQLLLQYKLLSYFFTLIFLIFPTWNLVFYLSVFHLLSLLSISLILFGRLISRGLQKARGPRPALGPAGPTG